MQVSTLWDSDNEQPDKFNLIGNSPAHLLVGSVNNALRALADGDVALELGQNAGAN